MKCLADARLLCLAAAAAAAAQAAQAAVFRPSQAAALRPLELAGLSLEEILGKVLVEPQAASHFSRAFFEDAKQRIKGQLDNISASQAQAQQSLDRLHDQFTACANSSDGGIEETEALLSQKGNLSASHKACRANESNQAAAFEDAEEVLHEKTDLEDAACDELDDLEKNPDMCHFQGDEAQGDGGYGDWLQRLKAQIDEMVDNHTRLNESCSIATAAADEQEAICMPLEAELNATTAACDRMQAELENTTCSLVTATNRTCSAHGACLTDAWDALQAQLPIFQEAEANRTAEWRALSQMLCLTNAVLEGAHETIGDNKCGEYQYDTVHLNLDHSKAPQLHPNPLGHRACTPLAPDPCSTEYLDDEYGELPENVETQACNVCPLVPVNTTSGSRRDTQRHFLMARKPSAARLHKPDQVHRADAGLPTMVRLSPLGSMASP